MTQSFEDEEMLDLPSSASGIFNRMEEDGGAQSVAAALGNSPMSVPMAVEEYDGASSGMALGGMITAALAFIVVAIMATGGTGIASWFNSTMGLGIPLIVLVVLLGAGFVVGRATD
jgi:thiol:disulfide interchange protein